MAVKSNEDGPTANGSCVLRGLLAFDDYPDSFDRQLGDRVTKRLKRS
jgi:hypothetical protein